MYAFINSIRNYLFDKGIFKASEFDLPIINVGNLAVGGSGKTPHIEYIIDLLVPEFNIATLSRGYGRKTKGFREVLSNSSVAESGDEPLQIKQKYSKIKVFVGEDRVEAITKILFDYPDIDVILLDDAYQHRAIKAGFNILLSDYSKIFTKDKSMPFGRLREYPTAANRSDLVVITKCPEDVSRAKKEGLRKEIHKFTNSEVLFSSINYSELIPYGNITLNKQIENVLVISALATPRAMIDYINIKYKPTKLEHLEFRDHYIFNKNDISAFIKKFNSFAKQNKIIIISEKDAIRLRAVTKGTAFDNLGVFILPIKISFIAELDKVFNKKIINYVRENKSDYNIHQN
ncbi:MAG: tetraacyldisaccharide 4'-kinase [Bacteroidetes bacterium]|nr:MAG: tetraacyldisaccharide 4'-kinase [Bacteroidota bacterium]